MAKFLNRTTKIAIIAVLAVILVTGLTLGLYFGLRGDDAPPDTDTELPIADNITISFDVDGGAELTPLSIKRDTNISSLPIASKNGYNFVGWYTDAERTQGFFLPSATISNNLTLYAGYQAQEALVEVAAPTEVFLDEQDPSVALSFISPEVVLTKDNLSEYIAVEGCGCGLPALSVNNDGNDVYTVIPDSGYDENGKYIFNILDDSLLYYSSNSSTDYSKVKQVAVNITGQEKAVVTRQDGIIQVDYEDVTYLTDTSIAVAKVNIERLNSILPTVDSVMLIISSDVAKCRYIKVINVDTQGLNDEIYVIVFTDCDAGDVYSSVDINQKTTLNLNENNNVDYSDIVTKLRDNEGTQQLTQMLAVLLNNSPTVRALGDGSEPFTMGSYHSKHAGIAGALVNYNIDGLIDGMTVGFSTFEAKNGNFITSGVSKDAPGWLGIRLTFSYNATLANNVKVKAEVSITYYVYISLVTQQTPILDNNKNIIDEDYFYFKCYSTIYTQTDFTMKVLVASAATASNQAENPDSASGAATDEDGFKDITLEFDAMLDGSAENSSNNIIEEMQDMLGSEGGYIDLFNVPIFAYAIPVLSVFQINLNANFVVRFNFAAGISTTFSYLDAYTIGVKGDTMNYDLKFFKHKQIGADRYSMSVDVCGMIGMRAGIEASFSISFIGLQKLGEVGIAFECGVFAQLNGYAHCELWDDTNDPEAPMRDGDYYGGIYFQIGIYVDINLFARSEFFDTEAKTNLYSLEHVIFSAGERKILLDIVPADESQNLVILRGERTPIESVISVNGIFLDIVTGESETGAYTGDNLWVSFDHPSLLVYNMKTRTIGMDLEEYNSLPAFMYNATLTTKMHVYYTGDSCARMNRSQNLRGAQWMYDVDCVWAEEGFDFEVSDFGKIVTATFVVDVNGERETLASREVMAGKSVGEIAFSTEFRNKYATDVDRVVRDNNITDIYWSKDGDSKKIPYLEFTSITDDTTFVYNTYYLLNEVAFVYYDGDEWIAEVKTIPYGAMPTAPTIPTLSDRSFDSWFGFSFDDDGKKVTSSFDIRMTRRRGIPSKAIVDFNSDSLDFATSDAALAYVAEHYPGRLDLCYLANYLFPSYCVTFVRQQGYLDNIAFVHSKNYYRIGDTLDDSDFGAPYGKKLIGWATEENGAKVYNVGELPVLNVAEPITYYAVYELKPFEITLYDFDGTTPLYDTFLLELNDELPSELKTALERRPTLDTGIRAKEVFWKVGATKEDARRCDFADSDRVKYSVNCYLSYNVEYAITLNANGGKIDGDDTVQIWRENNTNLLIFSYSNVVTAPTATNDVLYEFEGWEDENGKSYEANQTFSVTKPFTLTAKYSQSPIIYTATASTEHGKLENGLTDETYSGNYAGWIAFQDKYRTLTLDNVVEDGKIWVFDIAVATINEANRTYVVTLTWTQECTVTVNPNNGRTMQPTTRIAGDTYTTFGQREDEFTGNGLYKDDARYSYVLLGYDIDDDGEVDVLPGATYTIVSDITFNAIWSATEKTFTITLDCSSGGNFADDTTTKTVNNLAYDSIIDYDSFEEPSPTSEYEHYEFKGWLIADGGGYTENLPEKITQNITLYASFEAIQYSVTFKLIDAETGVANNNYAILYCTYGQCVGNDIPDVDVITEDGKRLFSGWEFESGGSGFTLFDATTPIMANAVVKGTVSSVHVIYTLGGIEQECIETDIGATVTVKAQQSGYKAWEIITDGISSTAEGTFTMPNKDVTINAAKNMTGILAIGDGTNTDVYNVTDGTLNGSKAVDGYTYDTLTKLLTVTANGLTLSGETEGIKIIIDSAVTNITLCDFALTTNLAHEEALITSSATDLTIGISGKVNLTSTATSDEYGMPNTYAIKIADYLTYGKLSINGTTTFDKLVLVAQTTAVSVWGALYVDNVTIEAIGYSEGLRTGMVEEAVQTDNGCFTASASVLTITTSATDEAYGYYTAIYAQNKLTITDSTVTTEGMIVGDSAVTLTNCVLACDYVAANNDGADEGKVTINGTSFGRIGIATESWVLYANTIEISLTPDKSLQLISSTCAICTKTENGLILVNCVDNLTCYENAANSYYYSTTAVEPYVPISSYTLVGVAA